MKEYRYKINGNLYKVTVGDIEDNNVRVEVNGTPYTVELEKQNKPKIKPVVRTASTTPAAPPAAVTRPASVGSKSGIKSPLPGVILATIFGANIKNPKSPAFWLSAVLLVMISVFSILIHRHISWKKK